MDAHQQQQHRAVLAVDLDHTLALLLESAFDWRNAETGSTLKPTDAKSAAWHTALAGDGSSAQADEALHAFFQSARFATGVDAAAGALETLKPLRRFFFLVAVTDRPRTVEKQTREWLDARFAGVFDKLVFVDAAGGESVVPRKKELYDDFKVKLAVGSDSSVLAKAAEDVGRAILVGSVPWAANEADDKSGAVLTRVTDWAAAKGAIDASIAELDLKPVERVAAGPKLAKYTDDLVTVSPRKPAVFYANIINSKFSVQKQETVRLQASEGAIATAIQIVELLRMQKSAVAAKISTRYAFRRAKAVGGFRVPKIEVVLQRVPKVA